MKNTPKRVNKVTFPPKEMTPTAIYQPKSNIWKIKLSYDRNKVELLKKIVPPNKRVYLGDTHEWLIAGEYFEKINKCFNFTILSKDRKETK